MIANKEGLSLAEVESMLNKQSGLLGIFGLIARDTARLVLGLDTRY